MGRVIWKEKKVISVELRKGLFVLAQMHENPYLIFYNIFSFDDNWDNLDLTNVNILFYTAVTKQFLYASNVTIHKEVKPVLGYSPPLYWIKKNIAGHRQVTFWEGTESQITISLLGEGGGQL